MPTETLAPEIADELVGLTGTLVFGTAPAISPAKILRVGDGYILAQHVRRDRSPAGEIVTDRLVIPLTSLVYFRSTRSEDPEHEHELDFPIEA